eukprot:6203623-Pleurochrysis_carterae.AAC.1
MSSGDDAPSNLTASANKRQLHKTHKRAHNANQSRHSIRTQPKQGVNPVSKKTPIHAGNRSSTRAYYHARCRACRETQVPCVSFEKRHVRRSGRGATMI